MLATGSRKIVVNAFPIEKGWASTKDLRDKLYAMKDQYNEGGQSYIHLKHGDEFHHGDVAAVRYALHSKYDQETRKPFHMKIGPEPDIEPSFTDHPEHFNPVELSERARALSKPLISRSKYEISRILYGYPEDADTEESHQKAMRFHNSASSTHLPELSKKHREAAVAHWMASQAMKVHGIKSIHEY
jgi:hypothetical protein